QRDAMGGGEGGDDLQEGEQRATPQEKGDEEQEVVVPGQDVMDAEKEEATRSQRGRAALQDDVNLPRLGGEGELLREAGALDPRQRVVVEAEHSEEVVADGEGLHAPGAGEVHDEGDALALWPGGLDERLGGLAAVSGLGEGDLPANGVEKTLAALGIARSG